jgi:hypothetical protein
MFRRMTWSTSLFSLHESGILTQCSVLLEEPTPVVAPIPTEPQDIIRHLQKTNPEALALARDWEDTAEDLIHAEANIKQYVNVPLCVALVLMQ